VTRAPLPEPSELTAGFWDAARREELVVQRCRSCGAFRHYPQVLCPECTSSEWEWAPVSGRGAVHSFTVTHQAFHPAWADRLPYVVATIELDEGPRMVSDLDEDPDDVAIGRRVEVFFERVNDEITLPRFRLSHDEEDPR
jgi:uncharacterized OB-fold protein